MPLLARDLIKQQGASEVVLMFATWKTWSPTDKGVWGGWVAIITVFWFLFLALAFISGISAIDSHPAWRDFPPLEHIFIADVIFVAFFPGLAGVAQWLLLRAYIQRRSWWVPVWVLATIIGWTGVLVLTLQPPPDLPLWSIWIIGGAINSLLQWLVLRPYLLQAGWWALAQFGILIVSVALSVAAPFFVLMAGPFYAALSGYVLVSLFRTALSRRAAPTSATKTKWSWSWKFQPTASREIGPFSLCSCAARSRQLNGRAFRADQGVERAWRGILLTGSPFDCSLRHSYCRA